MRRNILLGCATAFIVVAMMLNMNISSKNYNLSDIALANVEALAENEGSNPNFDMRCNECVDPTYGNPGIIMYCIPGEGGCYDSGGCVYGIC